MSKKIKGVKLKLEDIHTLIDQITDEFPLKNIFSEKVFQAAVNPVLFYNDNAAFFKQFNLNAPIADLYCWLLVHELEHGKRGYTLDFTADLTDINFAISELSDNQITTILSPQDNHKKTEKMVRRAAAKLKLQGLALLNIDLYTDAYVLLLVHADRVKFINAVAEKCRLKIEKV